MEDLARRTKAAIVFPDYTRVPHQTFPYPLEQSYEVLDYMVNHASLYHILPGTIALAGDSVGGELLASNIDKMHSSANSVKDTWLLPWCSSP